jgi:hypothetical protein
MKEVAERSVSIRRLGDTITEILGLNQVIDILRKEALAPDQR